MGGSSQPGLRGMAREEVRSAAERVIGASSSWPTPVITHPSECGKPMQGEIICQVNFLHSGSSY